MNCEFCNKILSNASILKTHQKTAKYCLKIQGNIKKSEFVCEFCNKEFTRKHHLIDHLDICKNKNIESEITRLKEENNKFKEENNILKAKLEIYERDHNLVAELAKQPKHIHTQNNTNNKILNINSLNINKDTVQNTLENSFSYDTILDGQKSLAKFVVNNLLKDDSGNLTYVCTDPSRQIFKFKDSLGEVQKDVKANKLTNILIEGGIRDINSKVAQQWWTKDDGDVDTFKFTIMEPKASEINNITSDNSVFVNELTNMTS